MSNTYRIHVNGAVRSVSTEPDRSLLDVLREELDLTGAHYGCGEGQCGACTVLIDGVARRSCVTPVSEVREGKVVTIEGLSRSGRLHPVQQAFLDVDAFQCGYCTSGMILSAVSLLHRIPHPTEAQIIEAMNGNVCRCGTYRRIVSAIQQASKNVRRAE